MATAVGVSGSSPKTVSDEERRWMIVGICLTKVLTPALRDVLANEMPIWYQNLLLLPYQIDKQTFRKYIKNSLHSTFKLNYGSINGNFTTHKSSYRNYDYAVKDPVSLAKLFMKPFMASFTGFDQTMDTSAALSIVSEAQPFHGANGIAKKIRSDVRNEWAHCNFSHWTDVNYQAALQDIETLINNINLTPAEKKRTRDDLDGWKQKGLELCFGQPVDSELLKLVNTEVAELRESVKLWKEDVDNSQVCVQSKLLNTLETIEKSLKQEIQDLKERQLHTERDVEQLRQLILYENARKTEEEPRYIFMAPKQSQWFSGRESELDLLRDILVNYNANSEEKVIVAAVSGLGGSGKTSLTAEYIHKWKDYYQGGVYWFSGEDDVKLKATVDDIAAQFNTLHENSLEATLSKTLAVFSRITKPWLMVIDDMDEFNLSQNLLKLVSGSWQANVACFGHLIMTTRRTSQELKEDIPVFKESTYLNLECFGLEEAKNFVFKRTETVCDEQTDLIADLLFQKLGGLPLALEQACAYIKYLRCTLSNYLESYDKQSLQLLKKKKAISPYRTSEDRLAVHTTWLLNFEHIRQNENGMVAIRFLNATAFMNPNEIQKELINVGEPRVDDKAYCDHVSSSLGSLEVLKLLTDFSLFKETHNSSLTVHRLVQEVIRENLQPEEKVESIVDAARLLRFAFSNCPSPDELLVSVVSEPNDRPSLHSTDFSRFYKWHKMSLHAYEIKINLEKFLNIFGDVKVKTIFLPEVARIVYECALYLNVNNYASQAKAVADFANRILDWGDDEISEVRLKALFPHMFPLSESFRRLIQYSCKAPLDTSNPATSKTSVNDSMKSEIEKMRLKGNNLFKKSNFQEAIEIYSSCIDRSKGTDSFDPKLLSNRASAYFRLKQYNNALSDAEEYITYSPECWRGYAKKALALQSLNEKWNAVCAAALAFYHNRNIFEHFPPFQTSFPYLKQSIHVCDNVSSLVFLLSQLPCEPVSDMPSKIIVLKPGKYCLSAECFDRFRVVEDKIFNVKRLGTGGFCLVAVSDRSSELSVTLSFAVNFGLLSHSVMAVNISFIFELGNWRTAHASVVKLFECSVTSNIDGHTFVSEGSLSIKKCRFINCKNTALLVCGNADVEDSVFSGNESIGLQVFGPGNLVLTNSKLHGNQWGLDVKFATCDVTGCQIYDNKKMGVGVGNGRVKLTRNEVFHNDRNGIYLCEKSSAVIEENEIFENGWWGIHTASNASCRVSRNKIYQNKSGGIHIDSTTKASDHKQSIIEFNKIFSNQGPGIEQDRLHDDQIGSPFPSIDVLFASEDDFIKAKCTENEVKGNIEIESGPPSQDVSDICFFCHKQGQLKKCTRCFTAGYCNPECQKSDWKRHKNNCARLLEKYSVLVNILPLSSGLIGDKQVLMGVEMKAPFSWLEPSGPEYEEAPKHGKRFIVKIQACDGWRRSNEGGTLLAIEDRSLTIDGDLHIHEHSGRIYHLVRECGSNCNSVGWKKKFFWALLAEAEMVRVFISDFPTYQRW